MLKTFSEGISTGIDNEGISTGIDLFAIPTLEDRLKWAAYKLEADILKIPAGYRTAKQQRLVEADPEKIRKIPYYNRTDKQKIILRDFDKGEREKPREEALAREIEAGKVEGDWSRFKVGVNWMIGFPGLKNLMPSGKAVIREDVVTKLANKLQVGYAEIGKAISKAATRQMLTELEAKILRSLPIPQGKILWPKAGVVKAGAIKEEKSESYGEYYHKDTGWY